MPGEKLRDRFPVNLTPKDLDAIVAARGTREVPVRDRDTLTDLIERIRKAGVDDGSNPPDDELLGGEEHARRVVKELEEIFDKWLGPEDAPPVVLTLASNGVIAIAIGQYCVWDTEGGSVGELDAKTLYVSYYEEIREQAAVLGLIPSEDA